MHVFDRRPLGWLLLAAFSAVWVLRAALGAAVAVGEGESVVLFWRLVELAFFAGVAAGSYRRTSALSR